MSTQDRCIVCAEHVTGLEIILDSPMELLRYVGQVEARLGMFGDSVHLGCKIGAWFVPNIPQTWKSFWAHPMVVLGDVGQVEARFGQFGDSVKLDAR
jgi:hypothetical protein